MLNTSCIENEAIRIVREEREAKRRAAFEAQRLHMKEITDLAERERSARVQLEAEKIEAQKRAEEAIIAAKAKAEKDAYDAAVAAKVAELKNRPETEVLRAELEELRVSMMAVWSPYKNDIEQVKSQVTGCPWNTGISELSKQISELKTAVTDMTRLVKKPAREVHVWFSYGMTVSGNMLNNQPNSITLRLQYCIVDQTETNSCLPATTANIGDRSGLKISVGAQQKVFVHNAMVLVNGGNNADVTFLYKGLVESQ